MTPPHLHEVTLETIEPLLFGDSRSTRAGMDHFRSDQDASPLTVHGAIGMFIWNLSGQRAFPPQLGTQVDDILDSGGASVSELLAVVFRDPGGALWFPRPLHFRCWKQPRTGRLFSHDLLSPSKIPDDWKSSCPLPLVLFAPPRQHEMDEPLLVSERFLERILTCNLREEPLDNDARHLSEVFRRETRPGIVVQNATGTTEEGMFFSRPYRRFGGGDPGLGDSPAWSFQTWFATPGPLTEIGPDLGHLGGDRRRVRILLEPMASGSVILPSLRERVLESVAGSSGFFLYLLTPRILDENDPWPGVEGASPVAAANGRQQHVSGWNTKLHRPRPMIDMEAAGSVHFYTWPQTSSDDERRKIVEDHWLTSVGRGGAAGFGRVLVGVWR